MHTTFTLRFLAILTFFGLLASTSAQQVYEGKFEFDKKIAATAPGVAIEVKGEPETILARIDETFRDQKPKVRKLAKGMVKYEAVALSEVSSRTLDYYFKSEVPKNGPKRIVMVMSLGNDNFISPMNNGNTRTAETEVEAAKRFLKRMVGQANQINQLTALVAAQAKQVGDKETIQKNMEEEEKEKLRAHARIEEAIKDDQKVISENQKEILDAQKEIEAAKKRIAEAEQLIATSQRSLTANQQKLTMAQKEVEIATLNKKRAEQEVAKEKVKLTQVKGQLESAKE